MLFFFQFWVCYSVVLRDFFRLGGFQTCSSGGTSADETGSPEKDIILLNKKLKAIDILNNFDIAKTPNTV